MCSIHGTKRVLPMMKIELEPTQINPLGKYETYGLVYLDKKPKPPGLEWLCDGSFKYTNGKFTWFRKLEESYKSKAEERVLKLIKAIKRRE
jgi:hypothetical protein